MFKSYNLFSILFYSQRVGTLFMNEWTVEAVLIYDIPKS